MWPESRRRCRSETTLRSTLKLMCRFRPGDLRMQDTPARSRRHWADVAVILVGLGLFGLAIWFPPFTTTAGAGEVKTVHAVWPIYATAGGLTLIALFAGQRWQWRTFARLLLIAAVGVLVVGF